MHMENYNYNKLIMTFCVNVYFYNNNIQQIMIKAAFCIGCLEYILLNFEF